MKKVILVVDDEKNARDNLREIIEDIMGLSMVEADCAKTAIELIRNRVFDLILTDLRMPGESGMSVLEEAQRICPETPVIIMTAFGSADEAGEALKKGAYDFLSKPLRAGTVEEKIAETLRLDEKQD
ncbi:response regulator, partial [bacterium]|nr:response regulator [bacterium]